MRASNINFDNKQVELLINPRKDESSWSLRKTRHQVREALKVWVQRAPATENRVEAEKRIDQFMKDFRKYRRSDKPFEGKLNLSNLGLTTLPDNIDLIRGLAHLNLSNNHLYELPPHLLAAEELFSLDLSNNNISTTANKDFSKLKKLKLLSLENNNLNDFPVEIFTIESLTRLYLSNNKITTIPDGIHLLHELIALVMQNNKIDYLSDDLYRLPKLELLSLQENNIKEIHESISKLKKLNGLHLRNNQLEEFPIAITELENLFVLSFTNNKFKKLPKEIKKLKYLCLTDYINLSKDKNRDKDTLEIIKNREDKLATQNTKSNQFSIDQQEYIEKIIELSRQQDDTQNINPRDRSQASQQARGHAAPARSVSAHHADRPTQQTFHPLRHSFFHASEYTGNHLYDSESNGSSSRNNSPANAQQANQRTNHIPIYIGDEQASSNHSDADYPSSRSVAQSLLENEETKEEAQTIHQMPNHRSNRSAEGAFASTHPNEFNFMREEIDALLQRALAENQANRRPENQEQAAQLGQLQQFIDQLDPENLQTLHWLSQNINPSLQIHQTHPFPTECANNNAAKAYYRTLCDGLFTTFSYLHLNATGRAHSDHLIASGLQLAGSTRPVFEHVLHTSSTVASVVPGVCNLAGAVVKHAHHMGSQNVAMDVLSCFASSNGHELNSFIYNIASVLTRLHARRAQHETLNEMLNILEVGMMKATKPTAENPTGRRDPSDTENLTTSIAEVSRNMWKTVKNTAHAGGNVARAIRNKLTEIPPKLQKLAKKIGRAAEEVIDTPHEEQAEKVKQSTKKWIKRLGESLQRRAIANDPTFGNEHAAKALLHISLMLDFLSFYGRKEPNQQLDEDTLINMLVTHLAGEDYQDILNTQLPQIIEHDDDNDDAHAHEPAQAAPIHQAAVNGHNAAARNLHQPAIGQPVIANAPQHQENDDQRYVTRASLTRWEAELTATFQSQIEALQSQMAQTTAPAARSTRSARTARSETTSSFLSNYTEASNESVAAPLQRWQHADESNNAYRSVAHIRRDHENFQRNQRGRR